MFETVWSEEPPSREEIDELEGRTVVEFGAEWCPHCQRVQPLLEEKLAGTEVRHIKVADGKGKKLGRSFKVKLWPNFVFLRDGELVEQLARPDDQTLRQSLESFAG